MKLDDAVPSPDYYMFWVNVSEEVFDFADKAMRTEPARRKWSDKFDGTPEQRRIGLIGETVVCDMFDQPRPNLGTPDPGYDLLICERKVDVKTLGVTCLPWPQYKNNIQGKQAEHDCEFYLFLYFNKETHRLYFCGVIAKDLFFDLAEEHPIGSEVKRENGTSFTVVDNPMWDIRNDQLWPIFQKLDIEASIYFA